jgi:hypothetical protein
MTSITDIVASDRSLFLLDSFFVCILFWVVFVFVSSFFQCASIFAASVASNRFLLLLSLLVVVSPEKELQKEEQVAPVHDKGGGVVFLFDAAGRVRFVVIKAGQRDSNPDDHL